MRLLQTNLLVLVEACIVNLFVLESRYTRQHYLSLYCYLLTKLPVYLARAKLECFPYLHRIAAIMNPLEFVPCCLVRDQNKTYYNIIASITPSI